MHGYLSFMAACIAVVSGKESTTAPRMLRGRNKGVFFVQLRSEAIMGIFTLVRAMTLSPPAFTEMHFPLSLFRSIGVLLICAAAFSLRPASAQTVSPDSMSERVAACAACHGKEGRAAADGYYPRIAGKPAGYLYNQLINFREGRRQWPLMIYMVDHLSDKYLLEMAEYFASIKLP